MKKLTLIFILFIHCIVGNSFAQEVSEKQIAFANSFLEAVISHSEKKVIDKMDKSYRKEQLKFLEGRTTQFVNELFGGEDLLTGNYVNIKLVEIQKIEIAEVIQLKEGGYTYIFRIRAGSNDVLCSLTLSSNKSKFGFIGTLG